MSHQPERKEKDCLNCGTIVKGRFCHVCGQQNLEPRETFGHLVIHFFNDMTHFDGKFFTTLKDILIKPGFLSKEYMAGRRVSYLNPIQMYLFTSTIFFLLFFSFFRPANPVSVETSINKKTLSQINKMDSATFAQFTADINKENDKPAVPMSHGEFKKYIDSITLNSGIQLGSNKYKTKREFDSALKTDKKKPGWIERQLTYKKFELNEKYKTNPKEIFIVFIESLIHSLPQMFFVSLPILALFLKLLYVRRKQFYYVSHFIFSLHVYIFLFIATLFLLGLSKLNTLLQWSVVEYISTAASFGLFVYIYFALKRFYQQGWLKTFIKLFLLSFLFFIAGVLLFLVFSIYSLYKI